MKSWSFPIARVVYNVATKRFKFNGKTFTPALAMVELTSHGKSVLPAPMSFPNAILTNGFKFNRQPVEQDATAIELAPPSTPAAKPFVDNITTNQNSTEVELAPRLTSNQLQPPTSLISTPHQLPLFAFINSRGRNSYRSGWHQRSPRPLLAITDPPHEGEPMTSHTTGNSASPDNKLLALFTKLKSLSPIEQEFFFSSAIPKSLDELVKKLDFLIKIKQTTTEELSAPFNVKEKASLIEINNFIQAVKIEDQTLTNEQRTKNLIQFQLAKDILEAKTVLEINNISIEFNNQELQALKIQQLEILQQQKEQELTTQLDEIRINFPNATNKTTVETNRIKRQIALTKIQEAIKLLPSGENKKLLYKRLKDKRETLNTNAKAKIKSFGVSLPPQVKQAPLHREVRIEPTSTKPTIADAATLKLFKNIYAIEALILSENLSEAKDQLHQLKLNQNKQDIKEKIKQIEDKLKNIETSKAQTGINEQQAKERQFATKERAAQLKESTQMAGEDRPKTVVATTNTVKKKKNRIRKKAKPVDAITGNTSNNHVPAKEEADIEGTPAIATPIKAKVNTQNFSGAAQQQVTTVHQNNNEARGQFHPPIYPEQQRQFNFAYMYGALGFIALGAYCYLHQSGSYSSDLANQAAPVDMHNFTNMTDLVPSPTFTNNVSHYYEQGALSSDSDYQYFPKDLSNYHDESCVASLKLGEDFYSAELSPSQCKQLTPANQQALPNAQQASSHDLSSSADYCSLAYTNYSGDVSTSYYPLSDCLSGVDQSSLLQNTAQDYLASTNHFQAVGYWGGEASYIDSPSSILEIEAPEMQVEVLGNNHQVATADNTVLAGSSTSKFSANDLVESSGASPHKTAQFISNNNGQSIIEIQNGDHYIYANLSPQLNHNYVMNNAITMHRGIDGQLVVQTLNQADLLLLAKQMMKFITIANENNRPPITPEKKPSLQIISASSLDLSANELQVMEQALVPMAHQTFQIYFTAADNQRATATDGLRATASPRHPYQPEAIDTYLSWLNGHSFQPVNHAQVAVYQAAPTWVSGDLAQQNIDIPQQDYSRALVTTTNDSPPKTSSYPTYNLDINPQAGLSHLLRPHTHFNDVAGRMIYDDLNARVQDDSRAMVPFYESDSNWPNTPYPFDVFNYTPTAAAVPEVPEVNNHQEEEVVTQHQKTTGRKQGSSNEQHSSDDFSSGFFWGATSATGIISALGAQFNFSQTRNAPVDDAEKEQFEEPVMENNNLNADILAQLKLINQNLPALIARTSTWNLSEQLQALQAQLQSLNIPTTPPINPIQSSSDLSDLAAQLAQIQEAVSQLNNNPGSTPVPVKPEPSSNPSQQQNQQMADLMAQLQAAIAALKTAPPVTSTPAVPPVAVNPAPPAAVNPAPPAAVNPAPPAAVNPAPPAAVNPAPPVAVNPAPPVAVNPAKTNHSLFPNPSKADSQSVVSDADDLFSINGNGMPSVPTVTPASQPPVTTLKHKTTTIYAVIGRKLNANKFDDGYKKDDLFKSAANPANTSDATTIENIAIKYPDAQVLTSDVDIKSFDEISTTGLEVSSPSGIPYKLIEKENETPRAILSKTDAVKIDDETLEQHQQRLAITVMSMIDEVASKSLELNINTSDPFIAKIAQDYIELLNNANVKFAQHSVKCSAPDPAQLSAASTVFKKLTSTPENQHAWEKRPAMSAMLEFRKDKTFTPQGDAASYTPSTPRR